MLLSAYCLSYGNWTVIPSHWEKVFEDMKNCGFDAVDLSFSESEERYSMRTFEMQVETAHRHGLKVFAIPSRIGGRLAGAPFMPSFWLTARPHLQVPGYPCTACLESEEFVKWAESFIVKMLKSFNIDGIIWDEPKEVTAISRHPDTIARYGANPTESQMMQSSVDFVAHLNAVAKKMRPELTMTIFNMPNTPAEFTKKTAAIPGIDYAGFDGTCCKQSFFHEAASHSKTAVRDLWKRTEEEAKGKCGTFALIENILIPETETEGFREGLRQTLETVKADHLSCYYYGHNNARAEEIQKITMDMIKEYHRPN